MTRVSKNFSKHFFYIKKKLLACGESCVTNLVKSRNSSEVNKN